jgi:hypothetical protein
MRALNLIAHVTGAAVLLLAHVDKASVRSGAGIDSMTTFSGSTAWNNSARSRWAMYRDEQTIVLRHEKCNLGPLQDQIELEFDSISKTFKPFGTIPGSAFASKMMRNAQRDAIIKLIEKANKAEINLSMNVSARNNVFRQLSDDPDFPPRMERRVFFGLLRELKDTGLVREEPYRLANRTTGQRVVLTDAGRAHMEQA